MGWELIQSNFYLGLDAALPLISDSNRLSWRDARLVQTIQTNAGFYGDLGSIGHLDVCVNNGNIQPFCIKSASMSCLNCKTLIVAFSLHSFIIDNLLVLCLYVCLFFFPFPKRSKSLQPLVCTVFYSSESVWSRPSNGSKAMYSSVSSFECVSNCCTGC